MPLGKLAQRCGDGGAARLQPWLQVDVRLAVSGAHAVGWRACRTPARWTAQTRAQEECEARQRRRLRPPSRSRFPSSLVLSVPPQRRGRPARSPIPCHIFPPADDWPRLRKTASRFLLPLWNFIPSTLRTLLCRRVVDAHVTDQRSADNAGPRASCSASGHLRRLSAFVTGEIRGYRAEI